MRPHRPTHTTVVAYLALFVALGTGGAYAVEKIGTADLKRNAVTAPKIKRGAVRAAEVKDPIVRVVTRQVTSGGADTPFSVQARCRKNERFLSGGGGWVGPGTLSSSGSSTDERPPAPSTDYQVRGHTTQFPNVLEARVACLPR